MNAVKNKLIVQIENLDNDEVIKAISDMLNQIDEEGVYHLTDGQKSDLTESIDQIESGKIVEHDVLMNRLKQK